MDSIQRFFVRLLLFSFSIAASNYALSEEGTPIDITEARKLLNTYCYGCHASDDPEGDLDMVKYDTAESMAADMHAWLQIVQRVESGEMPPEYAIQPEPEEKQKIIAWIKDTLQKAACGKGIAPGPSRLRRMNRSEYASSIRDLMNIQYNAGHSLPADGAGGEGFDNAAETLFISPVHAERYLESAKEIVEYAAKEARAREHLFNAHPNGERNPAEAAEIVLERFASNAFRRPVTADELSQLMALFQSAFEREEPYESAVFYAMQAVLISPNFLFLAEDPNLSGEPRMINDYELADRLSYFLWSSVPDDVLLNLAMEGKLQDEDVLVEQVDRMLKETKFGRDNPILDDRKFHEFAVSFVSQWLGTRELGISAKPDQELFPRYDQELESAMQYEPVFLFQEVIDKNLSLIELLDCDFTYLTRKLARHYGLGDEVKVDNNQPQHVELPEGSRRGGLLTMAGVLTVSSMPTRTSPVLRGVWVLDKIFGAPPPPPPPNVPELPESEEHAEPTTLRERLEQHRNNPACASCHDRIDPIGFGLENFDAVGRWRDEDGGKPVDSSGQLPSGEEFNGPAELKEILLERKDEFIRNLTIKMLAYALGRGLVLEDYCTVDHIVEQLKKDDYKARTLVYEIVKSVPFRYTQSIRSAQEISSGIQTE